MLSSLITKIKTSFKNKKFVLLTVCLLLGFSIIIFISSFSAKKNVETKQNDNSPYSSSTYSSIAYSREVSSSLENLLSAVNGLSNVKVSVIVESSPKIEYLFSGGEQTQTIVYDKQTSSSRPAVVKEILPKITGILIVAKGANNLQLKNKLIIAISATYGVDISKIDILEGK